MAHFVEKSHVFVNEDAKTANEALKFLAEKAVELGVSKDADEVFDAFVAREQLGSTGMVGGVAIPHAKGEMVSEPSVIIARFANPVEWDTIDNAPVVLAIALLIPADERGSLHLKNLSKIAGLLVSENAATELTSASDADELARIINEGLDA